MSSPRQYGLLPCKLQGGVNHETTGKRPYLVRIIVCCTLLIFTLLTRNRLCEVRLKDGYREVTASLAYESGGK